MNIKNTLKPLIFLLLALTLTGCAAALLGTAAVTSISIASDRRTTGTVIDDESIEIRINYEITANDWLRKGTHVTAVSVNGVVLLLGQVASQDVKNEIAKIAYEDERVANVVNEIEVGPTSSLGERSKDAYISSRVKTSILASVNLNPSVVNVTTERGKVYLMGLVSHEEADLSATIASRIGGVKTVIKVFEYRD